MSVAAPVYHGPKVVAAVNVSLQAQSVAAKPDPEAFLESRAEGNRGHGRKDFRRLFHRQVAARPQQLGSLS